MIGSMALLWKVAATAHLRRQWVCSYLGELPSALARPLPDGCSWHLGVGRVGWASLLDGGEEMGAWRRVTFKDGVLDSAPLA